jgi:acyl-CoA synthetase (AMP-forming)/AMP-acid ligase II
MNIALFLQMAAEACPDRVALTYSGKHYTYSELYHAAERAAALFISADVGSVALLDVSSPAIPIALMGAAMAGKPYVPLNYRLSQAQLDPLLERITPTFLIHGASLSQPDQKSGRAQLSTDFLDHVMEGERPSDRLG